jgi:hypothetical protein
MNQPSTEDRLCSDLPGASCRPQRGRDEHARATRGLVLMISPISYLTPVISDISTPQVFLPVDLAHLPWRMLSLMTSAYSTLRRSSPQQPRDLPDCARQRAWPSVGSSFRLWTVKVPRHPLAPNPCSKHTPIPHCVNVLYGLLYCDIAPSPIPPPPFISSARAIRSS